MQSFSNLKHCNICFPHSNKNILETFSFKRDSQNDLEHWEMRDKFPNHSKNLKTTTTICTLKKAVNIDNKYNQD